MTRWKCACGYADGEPKPHVSDETCIQCGEHFVAEKEEEIVTNAAGGRQHKVEGRFDLLPPFALDRIAKILEVGAAKYGDWNWIKIPSKDHLNHAINHLFKLVAGDTSEDHAGNAGCRILFLLDMLYREAQIEYQTEVMQEADLRDVDNKEYEDTFPVDKNSGKVYCEPHTGAEISR